MTVALGPEPALAALAAAAERWGAEFERRPGGGRLLLPVVAGIRRGVVEAVARVASEGSGSRVELEVLDERWRVQRTPLVILLFGAFGGVVGLLWPLVPALARLVPVALVLAFCAWFLVVARLQTSGPADFLETLIDPREVDGGDTGR